MTEEAERADAERRQELALAILLSVRPSDRALAGWCQNPVGRAMLTRIALGQECGG